MLLLGWLDCQWYVSHPSHQQLPSESTCCCGLYRQLVPQCLHWYHTCCSFAAKNIGQHTWWLLTICRLWPDQYLLQWHFCWRSPWHWWPAQSCLELGATCQPTSPWTHVVGAAWTSQVSVKCYLDMIHRVPCFSTLPLISHFVVYAFCVGDRVSVTRIAGCWSTRIFQSPLDHILASWDVCGDALFWLTPMFTLFDNK